MAKQKFVPALGFDFLTAYYDLTIKLTMPEKKIRDMLVEEIDAQSGDKVLEFGFGTGQNLLWVKNKNPQLDLVGLDIDPKAKLIAAHKLAKSKINVPLDLYDGNSFPYLDNQFDKVYSCLVFHQLESSIKLHCLKEIYRVLKPNGQLIIADWGKAQNRRMRIAFGLVQLLDGFKTTNDNVKGLLPEMIINAEFEAVKIQRSVNTAIGTFSYYKAKKMQTKFN